MRPELTEAEVLAEFRATTVAFARHVDAGLPPPVLTAEEYAQCVRLTQRHHRKFPPPVESLQLTNRPDGSMLVRAVNSRRPVVHVPERRELSARPRERRPRRVRRSSGSRGDPSRSDEADPPLARCSHCGEQFTPARSDAKFCGRACKQAAYRRRQQPPRSLSDVVWKLRHDGEIDGVEALLLLIAPPADVVEQIEAA